MFKNHWKKINLKYMWQYKELKNKENKEIYLNYMILKVWFVKIKCKYINKKEEDRFSQEREFK